ncbi:glycosyltransferase [Halieaceae bacterium IMCC14734]|uniref:Glycosyltransferase n=1 Tax=Candidatus Litorirhabdus singularis TaxID=2518993 RepID=A0ABT3TKX5_9GAMM|nr:glycosyltransferase [Candidatus Litorirhabdus singularis]MCX2982960.1 glycosyltransferase [Candidatus Litorirhabdus singularis]
MTNSLRQSADSESGNNGLQRLSVAIVCFHSDLVMLANTIDSLERSLAELVASADIDATLTVVDNSCNKDYGQSLQGLLESRSGPELSSCSYIGATVNSGFGVAHNQALEQVGSDYHLILNPDVELAADAIGAAVAHLREHPEVVLASPSGTNDQGDNQYLCKRYPSVLVLALRAFAPQFLRKWFAGRMYEYEMRDMVAADVVAQVPLVSGCCMFVKTDAMRRAGGFCADYFMYFEDYDLSLRLATQGPVHFLPQVHIIHHGGYSARKGWKHIVMFARSGRRFFQTHGWRWI